MIAHANAADWSTTTPADLLRAHLCRTKNTAAAYRADLVALGGFLGIDVEPTDNAALADVVAGLVDMPRGAGKRTIAEYAGKMKIDGAALNTIRRRICSTLSLLSAANEYDVIDWTVKFRLPTPAPVRDTSGPDRSTVDAMFAIAGSRDDGKGDRDLALLALLFYQAFRRGEVISLRLCDIDIDKGTAAIQAKGKVDRVRIALADETIAALAKWIDRRGDYAGPLFSSFARSALSAADHPPLTSAGLYAAIVDLGERAGAKVYPHGLRHAAITEALKLTNGNIRYACALSRHRNPQTLMVYDDARRSTAALVSNIVADGRPVYSPNP